MSNTREKLIGLVVDAHRTDNESDNTLEHLTYIADYLIAKGVTFKNSVPRFLIAGQKKTAGEILKDLECDRLAIIPKGEESIISVVCGGWIPVTERLPEDGDTCLVTVKYKYAYEKEYSIDVDVATYRPEGGYIDYWDTYNDWNEGQQYIHVTHWMPLPEAPEDVRE